MTCPFCQDTGIQAKGFIEVGCGHAEYEVACTICSKGQIRRKAEVKP